MGHLRSFPISILLLLAPSLIAPAPSTARPRSSATGFPSSVEEIAAVQPEPAVQLSPESGPHEFPGGTVRSGELASWAPRALTALHSSEALDESGTWALLSDPVTPPMLRIPVAVNDSRRDRMLAVEGGYQNGVLTVWALEFDPEPHWSVLAASGPPPAARIGPSLTYDPVRDRLLLFGGSGFNDVWELTLADPPAWHPVATGGERPALRGGHSAIYDPVRDRIVVFGGGPYRYSYLSDAWALSLSSNQWTLLAPIGAPPPGRAWHRAIYDPWLDRMLVFGGEDVAGRKNDLWELSLGDGLTWNELVPAGVAPAPRSRFAAICDPVRHRMVVQGGASGEGFRGDLWTLSLAGELAWTQVATEDSLEGRMYQAAIYDSVRDRLVVYGGTDNVASWDECAAIPLAHPVRWTRFLPPSTPVAPGPRSGHVVVYDSRRDRLLVFGGTYRRTDMPLWAFTPGDSAMWEPIPVSGPFPGSSPAVYDPVGDRIVAYTGSSTWTLSLDGDLTWTPINAPGPPERGGGMSVIYDPVRRRMIMYGGVIYAPHADFVTLSDVWALSLDGAPSWTRLGDGPVPYGSAEHTTLYDPVRDRMVVMGGYWMNGSTIRRSYGEYISVTRLDGPLTWTKLPPPDSQPPEGRTIYDSDRDRLLRFGGNGISSVWARPAADSGQWALLGSVGVGSLISSPVVFDSLEDEAVVLFTAPAGAPADQAWALVFAPPTIVLRRLSVTPDEVNLVWYSALARSLPAVVQRRESVGEWAEIARVQFNGLGRAIVRDRAIRPGGRYAYRLGITEGEGVRFSDSVWVDVPVRPAFALRGARPNPASQGLNVNFSLPDASPARLEVMDVAGRRVLAREVGDLGAGSHTIGLTPDRPLAPGLYLIRLTRAGLSRTARAVVIR